MFCSSCGTETTGNTRFCRACGKPLATSNLPQGSGDDPYQTKMGTENQPPPDPFKTVVAMQAPPKVPKPSTPPPAAAPPKAPEPDPFATQVSPSFDAAQVARAL